MQYVQIMPAGDLPGVVQSPCKVVLIVEAEIAADRRATICHWLLESGCLFLMAWGHDCADWAATMEQVNRAAHTTEEIPDDQLIITTAHADESLEQVFWFAKYTAMHPCASLESIVLVHLAGQSAEKDLVNILQRA